MVNHIILGLNIDLGNIKRVKIDNCNFESEIKELKIEASKQVETPPESLELVHQGNILEENKTLKDYSVRPGDMVYVLKKYVEPVKETKAPKTTTAYSDIIHTLLAYRGLRTESVAAFKSALPVFKPENVDKFITIAPELETDPVALSFMSSPELLFLLQYPETFNKVNEEHPVLLPAFVKIFKALVNMKPPSIILPMSSQQFIESDEEYEDPMEEEYDDDDDSDAQQGERLITPEQLSAALAMARAVTSNAANTSNNAGSGPSGSSSNIDTGLREFLGSLLAGDSESPSNSGTPSRSLITRDMFSNALSQAITSVANTSANTSNSGEPSGLMPTFTPSDSPTYVPTPSENNYTEQLTRMQEMGLMNHRVNLRALIVSNGDVNSAINLVLSGAIDD